MFVNATTISDNTSLYKTLRLRRHHRRPEKFEIVPFPGFSGGVTVATGDITDDGIADIINGAGPEAGPHIKVFDGATGELIRSFFAFGSSFRGGVTLAAGDITGDALPTSLPGPAREPVRKSRSSTVPAEKRSAVSASISSGWTHRA